MRAILVAAALALPPARAADLAPAGVADLLAAEIATQREALHLAGAPPFYHLRYHALLLDQASATASFGALVEEEHHPAHVLGIEVRLGDPSFDNTGFGGWETGFGTRALPAVLTPHALRLATWSLTDWAYKEAVEQYARKRSAFVPPPDHPGDYRLAASPTVASAAPGPAPDPAAIRDLVRSLSSGLPTDGSLVSGSSVVACETGLLVTVDSEGTRVVRPHAEAVVRVMASARAADGMMVTDHRTWIVRTLADLPGPEALAAAVRDLAGGLRRAASARLLEGEYVGPVLFEDGAAVDLFRHLLLPQVEGTPTPIPFDSEIGPLGEGFLSLAADHAREPRLGRRVLPEGWSAFDDPLAMPRHPASFRYDLEGTPARRVDLVSDGIVRTLLMSRVPRREIDASNGHARGGPGARPAGRASLLEVVPARRQSRHRLHRTALALARSYGLDGVVVVRRVQDDTVRRLGDPGLLPDDEGERPPLPVEVVWLRGDGREEPLRGAALARLDRFALRDVVAAGSQVEGTFLASFEPGRATWSPVAGMPTWLSVPEVLVGELEIVPLPPDPRSRPAVPPPASRPGATERLHSTVAREAACPTTPRPSRPASSRAP